MIEWFFWKSTTHSSSEDIIFIDRSLIVSRFLFIKKLKKPQGSVINKRIALKTNF